MTRGWGLGVGGVLLAAATLAGPASVGPYQLAAAFVRAELAPPIVIAQTQSTELHIKFKSGQAVVPIYEGWERVPDGSFNMVFGYLNRNHVEELSIPIGAQNG